METNEWNCPSSVPFQKRWRLWPLSAAKENMVAGCFWRAIGHAGAARAVASQSLTVTNGGKPKWTSRANRPATPENAHAKDLVAQKTIRYFKTERF